MIDVTAAILIADGRVLIARRRPGASQAGMWEFPGGKVRPGETPAQCLRREIREELGVEIAVGDFFGESVHTYGDRTIRLLAYYARLQAGRRAANEHAELRWVGMDDLDRFSFCPADVPLARKLQGIP